MLLEFVNITAGYGNTTAVNDISFAVPRGEIIGIIGPNGAGKTTIARLIANTISPMRGTVFFDGTDMRTIARKKLARHIATMPQLMDSVFPFPVEEFVAMGRFPHRQDRFGALTAADRVAIDRALTLTDTNPLRLRPMNELSGGERQRVILAQALAQTPELLLLDEPTSHLDIGHQIQLLELVRMLNREHGLTVIVVLHDLTLAGEYCSKLMLLKEGTIHAQGTPGEVLTYQNIEQVYNTVVIVKENPFSHKPYVLSVPYEFRR